MDSISVVIPTVGRRRSLRITLLNLCYQLERLKELSWELVVVDDTPSGTEEPFEFQSAIYNACAEFTVVPKIVQGPRTGRAAARNAGAAVGESDILLFIDEDIVVDANLLGACTILRTSEEFLHPTIYDFPMAQSWIERISALPSPEVVAYSSRLWNEERLVRGPLEIASERLASGELPRSLGWLASPAGTLAISRRAFVQTGGFDVNFGKDWGCEDLEFGYRLIQSGLSPKFGKCSVIHLTHPRDDRAAEHSRNLKRFQHIHPDRAVSALHVLLFEEGGIGSYTRKLNLPRNSDEE